MLAKALVWACVFFTFYWLVASVPGEFYFAMIIWEIGMVVVRRWNDIRAAA